MASLISVDIWLPDHQSAHIEINIVDNKVDWSVFDGGEQYTGVIFNHEGSYLELLEKVLYGRNLSS